MRAGKRLWLEQGIDTTGLPYGYRCGFVFSFEPQEETTYVSEYRNANMRCQVRLYRLNEVGERVPEPSLRVEQSRLCMI